MKFLTFPAVLLGLAFVFSSGAFGGAQAAPFGYSAAAVETTARSSDLVVKAVTRAGVAHRSTRRTARRVTRRHVY